MANNSLSPKRQNVIALRRTQTLVMTLALQRARKVVLAQLRAQGIRPGEFSARQITELAEEYFGQHTQTLINDAVRDVSAHLGLTTQCPEIDPPSVCKATKDRTLAEQR